MNKLDGKWKVTGKTGVLRALVGDVKHIKGNKGHNRLFGFKWGRFDIKEIKDGYEFKYQNGMIDDLVWFVNSDKLNGEFFLENKFTGNFTMERMK